jgi:hypothetical protein
MITFRMVMHHVVLDCVLKRCLPEEDHSVQTFRFDRAHEASGERFQNRRSRRQSNEVNALTDEHVAKLVRVFCISVEYQIPLAVQDAVRLRPR